MPQHKITHHPATAHKIQPWKNGQGKTAEIAKCPDPDRHNDFIWRLSIATISQDGPFSVFPGIDRTLILLSGNGIELSFDRAIDQEKICHRLDTIHDYLSFQGEEIIHCHLIAGETTDFNIMTRRDLVRHEVQWLQNIQADQMVQMRGETLLIFCLEGTLSVNDHPHRFTLEKFDTLEITGDSGDDLMLSSPNGASCALIHIVKK